MAERHRRRGMAAAAVILAVGLLLTLSPLLWGPWSMNKYVVAFGVLALCWGMSALLLAVIDGMFRR
jgi:hypothetical protein